MESFVSVIAKVVILSTSQMSQFADQVRKRLISQLIRGILRVLGKVSRYLNGKAISTSKVTSLPVPFMCINFMCINIAKTCWYF